MWEQGIPHHKRDLCGPRLVSELSGAARRFIVGKKPGWVSFHGGVGRLLQHLRTHLGLPQIPEMTEYLLKYFNNGKRKRQESMGEYITRKCEIYARARQSLSRLMASQGPEALRGGRALRHPHGPTSETFPEPVRLGERLRSPRESPGTSTPRRIHPRFPSRMIHGRHGGSASARRRRRPVLREGKPIPPGVGDRALLGTGIPGLATLGRIQMSNGLPRRPSFCRTSCRAGSYSTTQVWTPTRGT